MKRKQLNLTLENVGNAVGVSKSTVKKWEDGSISNMKRDKIVALAKVLQISPVLLIETDDIDIKRTMQISDKKIEKLYKNYNLLNCKGKEKLLEYSEDLITSGNYLNIKPRKKRA